MIRLLGSSFLQVNSHLSLFQESGAKWRADDRERGTTPTPSLRSAAHFLRRTIYEQACVNAEEKQYRGNKLVDGRMCAAG